MGFDHSKGEDTIIPIYRAIYQNNGNKTEAVINVRGYYSDSNHHYVGHYYNDSSFLIKSDEVVIKDYKFSFPIKDAYKLDLVYDSIRQIYDTIPLDSVVSQFEI